MTRDSAEGKPDSLYANTGGLPSAGALWVQFTLDPRKLAKYKLQIRGLPRHPQLRSRMNTLILRFLEDTDDSFKHRESEALLVDAIPRRGETITVNHNFHAVANVIHNFDAEGIEVQLGPARETAEEALQWLVENSDFVIPIDALLLAKESSD